MNDILPPESARWEWLEAIVRRVMAEHAYRNVRMPIMEQTQLYTRGLGEVTDIVEKEMYAFEDRADQHGRADHLALRPEGTAGLVRAVAEHNLLYDGGLAAPTAPSTGRTTYRTARLARSRPS